MDLLQTYVAATLLAVAQAAPFQGTRVSCKRQLADTYDYVIVGGGAAGLTVANRLSEDSGACLFASLVGTPFFAATDIEI